MAKIIITNKTDNSKKLSALPLNNALNKEK